MGFVRIYIEGYKVLLKKMKKAPKQIDRAWNTKVGKAIGLKWKKESQRNSKVDRGRLREAIDFEVGHDFVACLVPRNSMAGRYAKLQHDVIEGRGKKTRQVARRGWKFIKRARDDNRKKFVKIAMTLFKEVKKK